jgi:hypothetical protein
MLMVSMPSGPSNVQFSTGITAGMGTDLFFTTE